MQKHPAIVGGLLNIQEYAKEQMFHVGIPKFNTLKSEATNIWKVQPKSRWQTK